MKYFSTAVYTLLIAALIISCKKPNNNNEPIVVIPITAPDTLSNGWSKIKVNPSIGIFHGGDIFFNSNNVGYVSDNNSAVFKTIDGGSTWNQIFRTGGRSFTASNMSITTDNKAFFVGTIEDSIFKTTDIGNSITAYNISNARLSDIFFGDNNVGLCSSNVGLYKTIDAGNSWSNISVLPISNVNNVYSPIFMIGNSNAWVCYGNKVFHANGSLSTFKLDSVPTNLPDLALYGVFATSASVVYVSSYSGYLFKSIDGGNTFSFLVKLGTGQTNSGSDLHFINATVGYCSVGNRIYKTVDAGGTWSVVVALGNSGVNPGIIEIHFTDSTHGWALTSDGYVLKFN
jgi:photosystem II stability/assembly factor-like uncharacterized protein